MVALYICDIDGTVANGQHRIKHLNVKDYDKYYSLTSLDEPIMPVILTIRKLMFTADVWFFSGRNERCREDTFAWLKHHVHGGIRGDELVMRRRNDYRDDVVVKQEMLDNMLTVDRERLVGVFDDRQRVVDMWRDNGIACFQCAPGDY